MGANVQCLLKRFDVVSGQLAHTDAMGNAVALEYKKPQKQVNLYLPLGGGGFSVALASGAWQKVLAIVAQELQMQCADLWQEQEGILHQVQGAQ